MKKEDDGAVTLSLPEEDDGGTTSSLSPSNAAAASDPSNVAVGEQGPDAGPILLDARRRRLSVDLRTSSNFTDHVSFLIFSFLSKYFIASYRPISRCLFRLVEIASWTFVTEKERLFPAFIALV